MTLDKRAFDLKRELKMNLRNEYKKTNSLSSSTVVEISQRLDKIILKFMTVKGT